MSGERVGFRFTHADAVVKRNPQGRSRRGWVMEAVEQTTSRGTKMPAYRIRWRDSERPEIVLQHDLRTFAIAPTNPVSRHLGATAGGLLHGFHHPTPA